MANWQTDSELWVELAAVLAKYAPAPPSNPWTSESGVRKLLVDAFVIAELSIKQVHYRFHRPTPMSAMLERFGRE